MKPSNDDRALRQQIIDTCRQLNALGLNQGTSGNVSMRAGDDARGALRSEEHTSELQSQR